MKDSFGCRGTLESGGQTYQIAHLKPLTERGWDLSRLPYSLRILLENLLRNEDGQSVTSDDIEALAHWDPQAEPSQEIAFTPGRVLLQDFTGVPAVVDLAAMRDAMKAMGGDPRKINPLQPAELVIDHSVQVDAFGSSEAFRINVEKETQRNRERYCFLKWGQNAFDNFRVVPPGTGIVHQVNLEYLGRLVMTSSKCEGECWAYPDTLVGTDSHTTMINGLGVLGWGVGGIEAEAAMLGQPVSMLIPQVIGFRLTGSLAQSATATDLVLTVTQRLRERGVVGTFVEFHGPGLTSLPLADRATLANMAPEYGATCGIFPADEATLDYLRLSGRSDEQVALARDYLQAQGLFFTADTPEASYTDVLELDMSTVEASLAGPRRPQDRVFLGDMKSAFLDKLPGLRPTSERSRGTNGSSTGSGSDQLGDGSVVIAAITSCTNTSNPSVMIGAGLLARNAVARGLSTRPWVKTSLAPGSQVVTSYLQEAGLVEPLEKLGFHLVGYGCTTCIGNSGPLPEEVARTVADNDLVVASVLSGNRNFEGRVHAAVRANYLASPPLVVAFALAGRVDVDLRSEPLGRDEQGQEVYLKDIWPSREDVAAAMKAAVHSDQFRSTYGSVFEGDALWQGLSYPEGDQYAWDEASTYIKNPPYFENMPKEPPAVSDLKGARVLGYFGDSITTDHISPAGAIAPDSPAARYLEERGVPRAEFNTYGSRRGNHEVMMRGTFANIRIRNHLVPGVEGGYTEHLPSGSRMSIFDAAMSYREEGTPLIVLAGKEYGTGSSRDWAAKGPCLLGLRAVIAQGFERIHRSNLIGMGIVPLQFSQGESADSLGLTGRETYEILGIAEGVACGFAGGRTAAVRATAGDGGVKEFTVDVRLDTPQEIEYYRHGGILQYVLRQLLASVETSSR